jgi:hypothetical protein
MGTTTAFLRAFLLADRHCTITAMRYSADDLKEVNKRKIFSLALTVVKPRTYPTTGSPCT